MGDAGRSGAGCIGACTDPGRLRQRTGQKTGGTNGGKISGIGETGGTSFAAGLWNL